MNKVFILSQVAARWLVRPIMIFIAVLFAAPTFANTVTANCADPTTDLQALINSATTGEVILISGTCVGQFQVPTQNITLQGVGRRATLDGNRQGTVLTIGSPFMKGATLTISRLVIRNGTDGIVNSGTTILTHSKVIDNQQAISNFFGDMTIEMSHIDRNGGGVDNDLSSTMTITDSKVTANGDVGVRSNQASAEIKRSLISGNYSSGMVVEQSSVTVTDSKIADNVCTNGCSGAGVFLRDGGSLNLVDSVVVGNNNGNNGEDGGGILTAPLANNLIVTNSTISDNSTGGSGGGIYLYGGSLTLDRSRIAHNSAGIKGGGLFINSFFTGPAAFTDTDSITQNRAGQDGGGVCKESSAVTVPSSIVTDNSPDDFCTR
ncbi:MAG: hypothetical protein JO166_20050 [Deltaproteobacteria bacterium]|nr:hypothetical protein [Deltaproteobacteria bacterium]